MISGLSATCSSTHLQKCESPGKDYKWHITAEIRLCLTNYVHMQLFFIFKIDLVGKCSIKECRLDIEKIFTASIFHNCPKHSSIPC